MSEGRRHTRPFPRRRRAVVDAMRAAGRRNDVHGLVEFDVSDARDQLRAGEPDASESRSFTAFVVSCLARALEDPLTATPTATGGAASFTSRTST